MRTSEAVNLFMTPFLMWNRMAWKSGEMALASAQVIGHRASRLAQAGSNVDGRQYREVVLMGQEKGEAAWESAYVVCARSIMLNQQLAALFLKQMLSLSTALMSVAASRSAAESVARQTKLVSDSVAQSMNAASQASKGAARIARRALSPVHTRVSKNARRLRRRAR